MRTVIIDIVVGENGEFGYPDDISKFSNLRKSQAGEWIAEYSGNKDLPIYISPPPDVDRVITQIELEGRFPMRVQLLLADPSLAANVEVSSLCALLARRIALSEAKTANGDRGVDLDNPMTKAGVQEAMRLGLMTQDEVDAVYA